MVLGPLSLAFLGSLKRLRVDLCQVATIAVTSVLPNMAEFTEPPAVCLAPSWKQATARNDCF